MASFTYKGIKINASSKQVAIQKVVAGKIPFPLPEFVYRNGLEYNADTDEIQLFIPVLNDAGNKVDTSVETIGYFREDDKTWYFNDNKHGSLIVFSESDGDVLNQDTLTDYLKENVKANMDSFIKNSNEIVSIYKKYLKKIKL